MKKNIISFLFLFTTLSCTSTKKSESVLIFQNNIEMINAWNENKPPNLLRTDSAHSGQFVNRINADQPYSSTLYVKLSEISSKPIKKINVTSWVMYVDNSATPEIVVDVLNVNKSSISWNASGKKRPSDGIGKWEKISFSMGIEDLGLNKPENSVKIYISNGATGIAYVDDVNIEFVL